MVPAGSDNQGCTVLILSLLTVSLLTSFQGVGIVAAPPIDHLITNKISEYDSPEDMSDSGEALLLFALSLSLSLTHSLTHTHTLSFIHSLTHS